ncbi:MAG: hypothetical protein R2712_09325 [Vicinamibacterales bacterium]
MSVVAGASGVASSSLIVSGYAAIFMVAGVTVGSLGFAVGAAAAVAYCLGLEGDYEGAGRIVESAEMLTAEPISRVVAAYGFPEGTSTRQSASRLMLAQWLVDEVLKSQDQQNPAETRRIFFEPVLGEGLYDQTQLRYHFEYDREPTP